MSRGSFREWRTRGFERLDGGRWPESGDAILFFPSGSPGPAFLVTQNFVVLKTCNNSDAYALAVAHLADRLRGRGPVPQRLADRTISSRRAPSASRCRKNSADLGYKVADFDGHFDLDLRDDIRELQQKFGMTPTAIRAARCSTGSGYMRREQAAVRSPLPGLR